jgi:hypothetical protein
MEWNVRHDALARRTVMTADVDGLKLTVTERPAADLEPPYPATLTVEWFGVTRRTIWAPVAFRVAERIADAFSRLTFTVAGIDFTPGEVTTMVDLWEQLTTDDRVTGETMGTYRYSHAHLSPGVSGPTGNVNRMPTRQEIRALVLADGEECAYPATEEEGDENPWSHFPGLTPVTLTLISCGDYHGSDVDAANNRTIDGMPGVDVSYPGTGGMGSVESVSTTQLGSVTAFAVPENEGAPATADDVIRNLRAVVDVMGSIREHGLLSEEDREKYVREQAESWWSNGLGRDVMGEMENLNPAGPFEELPTPEGVTDIEDAVKAAYFDYDGTQWEMTGPDTATGVYNANHEEAVKHVAETVFGWTTANA